MRHEASRSLFPPRSRRDLPKACRERDGLESGLMGGILGVFKGWDSRVLMGCDNCRGGICRRPVVEVVSEVVRGRVTC